MLDCHKRRGIIVQKNYLKTKRVAMKTLPFQYSNINIYTKVSVFHWLIYLFIDFISLQQQSNKQTKCKQANKKYSWYHFPVGKIAKKQSEGVSVLKIQCHIVKKYTPTHCFFGDFAHWLSLYINTNYLNKK